MIDLRPGNALDLYSSWPAPVVIVVDGPYGIGSGHGDLRTPEALPRWYEPHVAAWSSVATLRTTLWFWGTEVGWATVHPLLHDHGWRYRRCCIWDKGIGHIAGNCNLKTLRRPPVVTEVCVQYVYDQVDGLPPQDWFRREWVRTGLPFSAANAACGVKDAATRKYLTRERHLWYLPPPDVLTKLTTYVNEHGEPEGRPYFAEVERLRLRPVFKIDAGITNIWYEPPLRGAERLKMRGHALHLNQKPLALIERIVTASSEADDAVWDPFAGTGTTAVACARLKRSCYSAEINPQMFDAAIHRLQEVKDYGQPTTAAT